MKSRVIGHAHWPAQFIRHPEGPRRAHFFGMQADQANRDGGDAGSFQVVTNRAHGAGTIRSNWDQDDGVDAFGLERAHETLHGRLHVRRVSRTHEGIVIVRNRANLSGIRKSL